MAYQNKTAAKGKKGDGALWIAEAKESGLKYLRGNVEIDGVRHGISVFKNTFKHEEGGNPKAPDYTIRYNGPMQDNAATPTPVRRPAPAAKPVYRKKVVEQPVGPEEENPPADDEVF